ncbi:hypothetical protein [Actinoallomurus sp. NPDC050550]|uniref:hypothetical protein n=1 Tax=Actinoallomurus sp. NPDC050550 TaxID=3154937 RepID=UPI00340384B0
MFRPLFLMVIVCTVGAAACSSQTDHHQAASPAPTKSSAAPSPSPSPSPSDTCASASDFVKELAASGATDFRVDGRIVCDGGWAAAHMKNVRGLTDPNWTVLRLRGGRWHLVTYGTDGLCDGPEMKSAPAKVKKALGPYC